MIIKIKKVASIFSLFIGPESSAHAIDKNYLEQLPDDSVLKKECHDCKKNWLSFTKSPTEKKCEYINQELAAADQLPQKRDPSLIASLLMLFIGRGNEGFLSSWDEPTKQALRIILEKYSDETKWEEYNKYKKTWNQIRQKRIEIAKRQKEEAEVEKEKQKRTF